MVPEIYVNFRSCWILPCSQTLTEKNLTSKCSLFRVEIKYNTTFNYQVSGP